MSLQAGRGRVQAFRTSNATRRAAYTASPGWPKAHGQRAFGRHFTALGASGERARGGSLRGTSSVRGQRDEFMGWATWAIARTAPRGSRYLSTPSGSATSAHRSMRSQTVRGLRCARGSRSSWPVRVGAKKFMRARATEATGEANRARPPKGVHEYLSPRSPASSERVAAPWDTCSGPRGGRLPIEVKKEIKKLTEFSLVTGAAR